MPIVQLGRCQCIFVEQVYAFSISTKKFMNWLKYCNKVRTLTSKQCSIHVDLDVINILKNKSCIHHSMHQLTI